MGKAERKKGFHEKIYQTDTGQLHQGRYNLIDAFLNALYDKFRRFELHREDAVARLIPRGEKLLDMGCGGGSFIFKVKDKFKELHGIDIASNRVHDANRLKEERHPKANISFRVVDIDTGLPYADGYFDTVTCIATFQLIYDPYFVIDELRRVLKKRGVLMLEVPNMAWLPRRISLLFGNLSRTSGAGGWDGGTLHYFTVGSMKVFLEEQGFKVTGVSGAGIFSSLRNWWVSLLSGDIIVKAEKN
ncbi:MAG: class I SAM-dependent methyltransferase [Nitrospirae bacterium]|nr:class I SAM-dependent methyltransferase [Nitrospirota bacterium]